MAKNSLIAMAQPRRMWDNLHVGHSGGTHRGQTQRALRRRRGLWRVLTLVPTLLVLTVVGAGPASADDPPSPVVIVVPTTTTTAPPATTPPTTAAATTTATAAPGPTTPTTAAPAATGHPTATTAATKPQTTPTTQAPTTATTAAPTTATTAAPATAPAPSAAPATTVPATVPPKPAAPASDGAKAATAPEEGLLLRPGAFAAAPKHGGGGIGSKVRLLLVLAAALLFLAGCVVYGVLNAGSGESDEYAEVDARRAWASSAAKPGPAAAPYQRSAAMAAQQGPGRVSVGDLADR